MSGLPENAQAINFKFLPHPDTPLLCTVVFNAPLHEIAQQALWAAFGEDITDTTVLWADHFIRPCTVVKIALSEPFARNEQALRQRIAEAIAAPDRTFYTTSDAAGVCCFNFTFDLTPTEQELLRETLKRYAYQVNVTQREVTAYGEQDRLERLIAEKLYARPATLNG